MRKKEFPLAGASLYSQSREGGGEERCLSQELSEKWGDMVTNSSTKRQVCQGSSWSDVYCQESGVKDEAVLHFLSMSGIICGLPS